MTRSDLERRLTAVLQQHAEDAMKDTDTEEQLDRLLIGAERSTRDRRRVWTAGALVAAAAAAAVALWAPGLDGGERESGSDVLSGSGSYGAERIATRFVTAYASFDRPEAAGYLADPVFGLDGWRRENRFFEETGFRMLLDPCRARGTDALGETTVTCPYDYDALRSDALGRGPFTGSAWTVTVRDGQVVAAYLGLEYEDNGFSKQVWEPFADWVSKNHPEDAAVMYADWPTTTQQAETPRSARLWRQHTLEYLKEQRAANLAPG